MRSLASICVVIFALIVVWYLSAFVLNTPWAMDKAKRAGIEISSKELVLDTWSQEKPKLPAPHQVGLEIWKTTVEKKFTSKRSLIFHSWITLSYFCVFDARILNSKIPNTFLFRRNICFNSSSSCNGYGHTSTNLSLIHI